MWHQAGHEEQWLKTERQRMDQMAQSVTVKRNKAAPARRSAPSPLGTALSGATGRILSALAGGTRRPALARLWSLF